MAALQSLPSTKSPSCAFYILLDVPPGRGFGFCSIVTSFIRIMECYRVTGGGATRRPLLLLPRHRSFSRRDDNRLADVVRRPRESLGAAWTETRSHGCVRRQHAGDAAGFLLWGLRDAVGWGFFRFPSHKNSPTSRRPESHCVAFSNHSVSCILDANGDISSLIMHIENRHGFLSFFEHLSLNMQDFPNLLAGGMEQTPGVYTRSSKSYPRLLGSSWCREMEKKLKNKGRSLIYGIMPPKSSGSWGRKEENECGETHSGGLYKQPAKP